MANALVDNDPAAATLEITVVGPELTFADSCVAAVAGAELRVEVDGSRVTHHRSFFVERGSTVRFGERIRGARAYLALSGGIDVPRVLGSRSTHLASRMGGFHGRALASGDVVGFGAAPARMAVDRSWRGENDTRRWQQIVRVLPGPQLERFSEDALQVLQSEPYRIGTNSDRMRLRLSGPTLRHISGADIVSEATPVGSLQIPASGDPILLMADRPTTGGYAKVAVVVTADLPLVAQALPGDFLRFQLCSRADALAALIARERELLTLEASTS